MTIPFLFSSEPCPPNSQSVLQHLISMIIFLNFYLPLHTANLLQCFDRKCLSELPSSEDVSVNVMISIYDNKCSGSVPLCWREASPSFSL